ncbi:M3 family oligoendopeptidase [Acetatifactor aquisgranensis]|uniref:M3 family oligoendopeptidase n=1 Tax=Acetatifactor aquisgranensis TaxID=2941233 RepID=UPI002040C303|nr:M3 family oligoendopeptidase [Acetatifactor aquisgranensis]
MIHFKEMPYERVSYEELEGRYRPLMEELRKAAGAEACMAVLKKRYELTADMTAMDLCYVRHDMDVNDAFYAAEQDYYDEIGPKLNDLSNQLDRLILDSPYRKELEKLLGPYVFAVMEAGQSGFDSRLIELAQEENKLLARYNQLTSNGTVEWEGEKRKRNLMTPLAQSPDRDVRRRVSLAIADSWEAQRQELEEIFDKLLDNRRRQAKAMGFSDYVELSYFRMMRIGYGPKEVAAFRELVKKYLVPLSRKLEERRRDRLGLEHLCIYDSGVHFPQGNPVPVCVESASASGPGADRAWETAPDDGADETQAGRKADSAGAKRGARPGSTAACLEATRRMYTEMSPETAEFIAFLLDNGLADVEIREGKRDGGYMTIFEKYRAPFIFANFDGTIENAYIMCHEGGHAFQGYLKRDEEIREHCRNTSEMAETHAMAMEFFAMPYMELFFGERAGDYRAMHLEDAVRLIINQCLQDEFQQLVYESPDMTAAECNRLWARLDREYFPDKDYDGNVNLREGRGWQRIPHIYHWPFYAIDYALAEICALGYYRWMQEDKAASWESYLRLCRESGTMDFPDLVESAGLGSPFEEETMIRLADWMERKLAGPEG